MTQTQTHIADTGGLGRKRQRMEDPLSMLSSVKTSFMEPVEPVIGNGSWIDYRIDEIVASQSVMVRKSGSGRIPKKSNLSTPRSLPEPPKSDDSSRQFGRETCPECDRPFNTSDLRPVQESCRHVKCRKCLISYQNGCAQCNREEERPRKRPRTTSSETKPATESSAPVLQNGPFSGYYTNSERACKFNQISLREKSTRLSSLRSSLGSSTTTSTDVESEQSTPPSGISAPDFNSPNTLATHILTKTYGKSPVHPKRPIVSFADTVSSLHYDPTQSGSSSTVLLQNQRLVGERQSVEVPSCSKDSLKNKIEPRASRKRLSTSRDDVPLAKTVASSTRLNTSRNDDSLAKPAASTTRLSTLRNDDTLGKSTTSTTRLKTTPSDDSSAKRGTSSTRFNTNQNEVYSAQTPTSSTRLNTSRHELPLAKPSTSSSKLNEDAPDKTATTSSERLNEVALPKPTTSRPLVPVKNVERPDGDASSKKKKKRAPVVIHGHITITSDAGKTMYRCDVCMKKFKTKAHIKYHEFCQNGEKPFKCEQCGQGFIAKSHYEYHLRTHTGERPYVCPQCGKGFNQRGKVTRHMRSHTGEKPFVCQQCGRGFANAQAMRSHFLIHTGERPFACEFCNKRFTGMTNLKKHVITHTGERPFMCVHCGKSFGLKWTLDLHLRTHSSERPYACDQCTRAFSNSKDLRRHLVIHSGERPFKCWICGTAFRRKDNLDRHIKNTHNQPKEVAKQLANEAAAEYLANSKAQLIAKGPPTLIPPESGLGNFIRATAAEVASRESTEVLPQSRNKLVPRAKSSQVTGPSTPRRTNKKVKRLSNRSVIITAEVSPPPSPSTQTPIDIQEAYILPNDRTDIPVGSLSEEIGVTEPKIEVPETTVNCVEINGFTELRTVPFSEYRSLDTLKLLEKAKSGARRSEANRLEEILENEKTRKKVLKTLKSSNHGVRAGLDLLIIDEKPETDLFQPPVIMEKTEDTEKQEDIVKSGFEQLSRMGSGQEVHNGDKFSVVPEKLDMTNSEDSSIQSAVQIDEKEPFEETQMEHLNSRDSEVDSLLIVPVEEDEKPSLSDEQLKMSFEKIQEELSTAEKIQQELSAEKMEQDEPSNEKEEGSSTAEKHEDVCLTENNLDLPLTEEQPSNNNFGVTQSSDSSPEEDKIPTPEEDRCSNFDATENSSSNDVQGNTTPTQEHLPFANPDEQFPYANDEVALFDIPKESLFGFFGPHDMEDSNNKDIQNGTYTGATETNGIDSSEEENSVTVPEIVTKLSSVIENGVIPDCGPNDEKENECTEREVQVALIKEMILEAIDDETLKHQKVKASFENHNVPMVLKPLIATPEEEDDGLQDIDSEEDESLFEADDGDRWNTVLRNLLSGSKLKRLPDNVQRPETALSDFLSTQSEPEPIPVSSATVLHPEVDTRESQITPMEQEPIPGSSERVSLPDVEMNEPSITQTQQEPCSGLSKISPTVYLSDSPISQADQDPTPRPSETISLPKVDMSELSNAEREQEKPETDLFQPPVIMEKTEDTEKQEDIAEFGMEQLSRMDSGQEVHNGDNCSVVPENLDMENAEDSSIQSDEQIDEKEPFEETQMEHHNSRDSEVDSLFIVPVEEDEKPSMSDEPLKTSFEKIQELPTAEEIQQELSAEKMYQDEPLTEKEESRMDSPQEVHNRDNSSVIPENLDIPNSEDSSTRSAAQIGEEEPFEETRMEHPNSRVSEVDSLLIVPVEEDEKPSLSDEQLKMSFEKIQEELPTAEKMQQEEPSTEQEESRAVSGQEVHNGDNSSVVPEKLDMTNSEGSSIQSAVQIDEKEQFEETRMEHPNSRDSEVYSLLVVPMEEDEKPPMSNERLKMSFEKIQEELPTAEEIQQELSAEKMQQDEPSTEKEESTMGSGQEMHIGDKLSVPQERDITNSEDSSIQSPAQIDEKEPVVETQMEDPNSRDSEEDSLLMAPIEEDEKPPFSNEQLKISFEKIQEELPTAEEIQQELSAEKTYQAEPSTEKESPSTAEKDEDVSSAENNLDIPLPIAGSSNMMSPPRPAMNNSWINQTEQEEIQDPRDEMHVSNDEYGQSIQNQDNYNYNSLGSTEYPQHNIHFVYSNTGQENLQSADQAFDGNVRIVYAAAAATAESGDDENGVPRKIRLLYAEALGYGGEESNQLQLVYATASPNQPISSMNGSMSMHNIELVAPVLYNVPADGVLTEETVQMVLSQQHQLQRQQHRQHHQQYHQHQQQRQQQHQQLHQQPPPTVEDSIPLPIQVMYGNGAALAQTVVHHPENLSLIQRSHEIQNFIPAHQRHYHYDVHQSFASESGQQTRQHYEMDGGHSGRGTPSSPSGYHSGSSPTGSHYSYDSSNHQSWGNESMHTQSQYEAENDGLTTLALTASAAAALTTLGGPSSQSATRTGRSIVAAAVTARMEESDATTRAAAAIAAVGQQAREQRLRELRERGLNPSSPTNNLYYNNSTTHHQGPRKHYLSQLSNFRE